MQCLLYVHVFQRNMKHLNSTIQLILGTKHANSFFSIRLAYQNLHKYIYHMMSLDKRNAFKVDESYIPLFWKYNRVKKKT